MKIAPKILTILQQKSTLLWLLIFISVFALTAALLFFARSYATDYLDQRVSHWQTEQAQLHRDISNLESPRRLHRLDSAAARAFITTSRDVSEEITRITHSLEEASDKPWLALFAADYTFSELQAAHQTVQAETSNVRKTTAAYSGVLTALEHFFAYNPAIDTADFSQGSADTKERMERLRSGLEQARSDVAVYQDHRFAAEILELLEAAEVAQEELEQTGDTEAFIATMSELQERTQSVLTSHYETIHPRLQQGAVGIGRSLP